jgi:hypothetical protein
MRTHFALNLKRHLLLVMLIFVLPGLAIAADGRMLSPSPVKTINPAVKKVTAADKNKLALKREAKILSIDFRTEPSGQWLYTYSVQNTGAAVIDLRDVEFKTTQDLSNGQRLPVHTVTLPTGNPLNPGQTVTGCYAWNRYSNATLLRLEVFYKGARLDVKTVSAPPIDVNITSAALDTDKNSWGASLKNNTGNAVKVAVRLISDMAQAGQEITKVVPANGTASCKGIADLKTVKGVQVIFRDETPGHQPGYVVLDNYTLSSGITIGQSRPLSDRTSVKATVESITWHRPSKQWVATVKNHTALPLPVGIAGWPLENGVQGMTVWSNETIPAGDTVQLVGDYSGYSVPPGTRLKVHVLLKPSNSKVHEKIIALD